MSDHKASRLNAKSGHIVATGQSGKFSKTDKRYWLKRVQKERRRRVDGGSSEDPHYYARVQHQGKRDRFPLGTPNRSAAAAKAADIAKFLLANGWDQTLARFKPAPVEADRAQKIATVGDLIRVASKVSTARPESLTTYTRALRRIAASVGNLKGEASLAERKYDASGGGTKAWQAAVDAISLSEFTDDRVSQWRTTFISDSNGDAEARSKAIITSNSLIRNAKALLSKKLLPLLQNVIVLPDPLPLVSIPLQKSSKSLRYASKIDARAILRLAAEELGDQRPESFKVLLLAAICGLRRREIDTLLWSAFDFGASTLSLEANQFYQLKSAESSGVVPLDPKTLEIFQGFYQVARGQFVIESRNAPKRKGRSYRCEKVFAELILWLRKNGVESSKPLHLFRKELGAIIATEHGIYAASRALRHGDIRITAQFYSDQKQRITPNLW